jgi:hypothetical protein
MKAKKIAKALSVLLCAVAGVGLTGILLAQTVYRSVDEVGNVSFADRPPMLQEPGDAPVDVLRMQIRLTDRNALAANLEEKAKTDEARAVAKEIRTQQAAAEANLQARQNEQRRANCELANARLTKYRQARRLYRDLGDGEREYLTDDELDAERAGAASEVSDWCGS